MQTETLARCTEFQVVSGCGLKCNINTEDVTNVLATWEAKVNAGNLDVLEVQVAMETIDTLIDNGGAPIIDTGVYNKIIKIVRPKFVKADYDNHWDQEAARHHGQRWGAVISESHTWRSSKISSNTAAYNPATCVLRHYQKIVRRSISIHL